MRKLLFLIGLFVILTSCSKEQIGWSSLTSTQWVSFQDAQSSGIYQKQPIPNGTNWMTKAAIQYYLDVNTSYLTSFVDNQWVPKSNIVAASYPSSNTVTWSFATQTGIPYCYMEISLNGTDVVMATNSTNSSSGSFTIHEGDVGYVRVYSSYGQIGGDGAGISITGSYGISWSGYAVGATTALVHSFTWTSVNQIIDIKGYTGGASTIYWNTEWSDYFWKTGCDAAHTPDLVKYTVPAHTYYSYTNQAEADQQAYNDAIANGQAYANSHGTCQLNTTTHDVFYRVYHKLGAYPVSYSTMTYTIYVNGVSVLTGTGDFWNDITGHLTVYNGDVIYITLVNSSGPTYYLRTVLLVGYSQGLLPGDPVQVMAYGMNYGDTSLVYTVVSTDSNYYVQIIQDPD
jgi:hypothetical protein